MRRLILRAHTAGVILSVLLFATPIVAQPDRGLLDDEAVLLTIGDAAAACTNTEAPAGWPPLMVGDEGCFMRVPPTWTTQDLGTAVVATSDNLETTGYAWLFFYLPGAHHTAESTGEEILSLLQAETPSLRVIHAENDDSLAGVGLTIRTLTVRFQRAGWDEVGSIRILFMGCQPILDACPVVASLAWTTVEELPIHLCTLTRIEESLVCPAGIAVPNFPEQEEVD